MAEDGGEAEREAELEASSDSDVGESDGDSGADESSSEPIPLEYSEEELSNILKQTDTDVLRLTLEETRPTLNTIESFLSDIDDKAGQTLRLNTIIIGLLLTIISILFSQNLPGVDQFLNLAFFFGLGASAFSIIAALLTYTRSSITAGLGVENIEDILESQMNERVLLLSLVLSHRDWIRENGRINQRDARTLFASHLFLFLSMGYYALAVLWVFVQPLPGWMLWVTILGITILLPSIIYLPQTKAWPWLLPLWNRWTQFIERIRR